MKKFIISLILGIVGQICLSFGWIVGLILMIKYDWGMYGFCAITITVMAIGGMAIVIESIYGLNEKAHVLKRILGLKDRNPTEDKKRC
jgi:hypothetical protein